MFKELKYHDCKYVDQKNFIEFCKGNSVNISLHDLELFEREKLLYPVKRGISSEEYAIFTHKQILIPPDELTYNPSYSALYKLKDEMVRFQQPHFFDKVFHPFDDGGKDWQKHLINPKDSKFTEWKNYEVEYEDENGVPWRTKKAKNFYSYWQIYELDAINNFRTGYYTIRLGEKDNQYCLTCNKESVEKWTRRPKNYILNISLFELEYNCLCDFIQFFNRSHNIAFKDKDMGEYLTPDESDAFKKNIIDYSNKIIESYDLSTEKIYDFIIKALCVKYFDYEQENKSKLQDLIKTDIQYCIKLISYITGKTWQEISSIIGESGHRGFVPKIHSRKAKNTLEIIFPDLSDEIKEKAMLHIDIKLKHYNGKVISKYQLDKSDIESFIEFIELNGLVHFLLFMADVDDNYFRYDYKSRQNLPFYLRNLSIFIEEIAKEICKNAASKEIRDECHTNKPGFRDILHPICNKESWWKGFEYLNSNGKFSKIYSANIDDKIIDIPKSVNLYSESENDLNEEEKFVLINLSIASIVRNFYAHNSVQQDFHDQKYVMRLKSTIISIFIIWAIGKHKL